MQKCSCKEGELCPGRSLAAHIRACARFSPQKLIRVAKEIGNRALTLHYGRQGRISEKRTCNFEEDYLAAEGYDLGSLKDPWGIPIMPPLVVDREADVLELRSAGPDKTFGTEDDFQVLRMSWPYFRSNRVRPCNARWMNTICGLVRDSFETGKSS